VAIETLFPLSLFSRHARRILVPAGLLFLVGIRALMGPTFEQFMLCYVFWIPWRTVLSRTGARVVSVSERRVQVDTRTADAPARPLPLRS
jgi:hypothetical protein